jgi:hypothetical protein
LDTYQRINASTYQRIDSQQAVAETNTAKLQSCKVVLNKTNTKLQKLLFLLACEAERCRMHAVDHSANHLK